MDLNKEETPKNGLTNVKIKEEIKENTQENIQENIQENTKEISKTDIKAGIKKDVNTKNRVNTQQEANKSSQQSTQQNTQQNTKTTNYKRLGIIGLLVAIVGAYFFVPTFNTQVNSVFAMFATGDFQVIRDFVESYGPYAMGVSFLLMLLQSLMAPLPSFLITFANANLFGWWQGAILSWVSAMAGAALCFWIAKWLGRDVVEKLTSKSGLSSIDEFFEKYGKQSVLIARLLPFISFDIVSYAAGLTAMDFGSFIIATGLGQLPATIIYSYVGGMLTGGAKLMVMALLILFALTTLGFLAKAVYNEKSKKKQEKISKSLEK